MIHVALICTLAPGVEARRLDLRADHLAFIAAHQKSILFGGPTLGDDGHPERMILILHVEDMDAARDFVRDEPYSANGVFSDVEMRLWSQVLPETEPGSLDRALSAERARHADEGPAAQRR